MTYKGREDFVYSNLLELLKQNYNCRNIEVCLSAADSLENTRRIAIELCKYFYCIKIAICDRSTLPFTIKSNCPACDRNATICNLASNKICIITDPEISLTDFNQLNSIQNDVLSGHMVYHRCHKMINNEDSNPLSRKPVLYGGFCLAVDKEEFINSGGFDENFVHGFAGEDSYFIWWWIKNKKAKSAEYPVIHKWHNPPFADENFIKLREEYTLPLYKRMKEENVFPNLNNLNWKRPEMIKSIETWKI